MKYTVDHFGFRLLVLSVLIGVPFFRMLLQHAYGLLYPEIAAALVLIVGVSACLAGLLRDRRLFGVTVVAAITLLSVNAVQLDFFPTVRQRWVLLGTAALATAGLSLLKDQFYRILLIFIAGSMAVDLGTTALSRSESIKAAPATANSSLRHVVHVVLDEMVGLAGMPVEFAQCAAAANRLHQVLEGGGFAIYPYAFSNYPRTRQSLSSILNGRLLRRTDEFLQEEDRNPVLRQNKYFDHYNSKGYAIRTYQSDYLMYASGASPGVQVRDYRSNNLKALHAVPVTWTTRLRQLFVVYLQSDRFWWSNWTSIAPKELHPERLRLGPIAFQDLWPAQVVADYSAATQNSLFFVHLLTPHYPYVYRPDGSLTDPHEWNSHVQQEFTDREATVYADRYRRYCDQSQFLATQLETLLNKLRNTGLYEATTVVIHGDHGSRLRLLPSSLEKQRQALLSRPGRTSPPSLYDYTQEPDARDLLNRFSTLLAIKRPGGNGAEIVNEPGGVLFFLQRAFGYAAPTDSVPDLNSVYLFDPGGSPRAITTMAQAFPAGSGPLPPYLTNTKAREKLQ